jgi:hypothetical protein
MPGIRRGVILLTIISVILGMIGASLYLAASGWAAPARIIPMIAIQVFLAVFYLAAYLGSRSST